MISVVRGGQHVRRGQNDHMGVPRPDVSGDCGWAGRAGEPLRGAIGYTDRVDDMPAVTGGKSTNCGSGARPQRLRTDQAFRCPRPWQFHARA